jgi:hypothetical protein
VKRVTHCALCDKPFRWEVIDGKRQPVLWSRWEDPDIIYCSEECCYITVTGRDQKLQ